jgi:ABC-2 type transport system permease protein
MTAKGYSGVVKLGFKEGLAYRFHFIIHIFTTPLSLLIYYFLWKSIFEFSGSEIIQGFTFQQMISYYAMNMIVGFLIWTFVDEDLEEKIISGTLTPSLLRPLDYLWGTFWEHMGLNLLSILLEIFPVIAIAVIFFGLSLPTALNAV